MIVSLKPEQILALAPNTTCAKEAIDLATLRKWRELGTNNKIIWGEYHPNNNHHYQTQIDLIETTFQCSCSQTNIPCQHSLALYLILTKYPDTFTQNPPPEWVTEWVELRRQKQEKKLETETVVDPIAQAKRLARREENVTAAVEELNNWVRDLIRQGLAKLPEQDYSFWDTTAARMVDGQARLLARQIRLLSSIPHTGLGWTDRLLERLGLLYLLLEGFPRRANLSPGNQADILTRIDWEFDKQISQGMSLRDRWLILGQKTEEIDGEKDLLEMRSWLWGWESKKFALILQSTHMSKPPEKNLLPGTCIDGELVFFPSAYPLRSIIKQRHSPPTPLSYIPGENTIISAMSEYTKALACQPWIERFPLSLQAVIPQRHKNAWILRDLNNHIIPITAKFTKGWQLLAISGGHPINIFGEWHSHHFLPLSALAEDCLIIF